jgi:hypothetical protein
MHSRIQNTFDKEVWKLNSWNNHLGVISYWAKQYQKYRACPWESGASAGTNFLYVKCMNIWISFEFLVFFLGGGGSILRPIL